MKHARLSTDTGAPMDVDELISNGLRRTAAAAQDQSALPWKFASVFSHVDALAGHTCAGAQAHGRGHQRRRDPIHDQHRNVRRCVLPLELARLASFGEMTTLAPA